MTWTTRPRSDFGELKAIHAGKGKGNNTTLLLLHGVGLRAEAWNKQITDLSKEFKIIAPDMPGHGKSDLVDMTTPLENYTDMVAASLSEKVIVIGHSMGAMIALDLASRYPEKVKAVVALNAVFQRSIEAQQAIDARVAELDGRHPADPSATLNRWFGDGYPEETKICKEWLTTVHPEGYLWAYSSFAKQNGPKPEALKKIKAPALFMTGELEPNSTPAMSKEMADLSPNGRALILENAAHMMPMTHAREVNQALREFIQEDGNE